MKIADYATHWQTGEKIDPKVKGEEFSVVQEKAVSQSKSRKAYLLHDGSYYIGWLLEQDVVGFEPYKSDEEIAKEVLDGKWGNNPERIQKLSAAGYDAVKVQDKVNELIKQGKSEEEPEEVEVADEQPIGGDEPELADNEVVLDGVVWKIIKK